MVCMYYYSTDESAIKVCAAFREQQQQQIERKNERETRERERERERLSVP